MNTSRSSMVSARSLTSKSPAKAKLFIRISSKGLSRLRRFASHIRRPINYCQASIRFQDDVKHVVKHYYFTTWPDHGVPSGLIEFCQMFRRERQKPDGTIIVHCRYDGGQENWDLLMSIVPSKPREAPEKFLIHFTFPISSAGVGRTGTFIALDIMMQRIKQERKINVFDLVKQLRSQRMKMVQTVDQYIFLYTSGLDLIEARRHQPKGTMFKKFYRRAFSFSSSSSFH